MIVRAVVTGVGVVSPFGIGRDSFFGGLAAGTATVRPIQSFDASALQTRVAGEVPVQRLSAALLGASVPMTSSVLERWEASGALRDRKVGFALLAAFEAWAMARCGEGERGAHLSLALGLEHAFIEDCGPLLDQGGVDWSREPTARLPDIRFRSRVDLAADLVVELLGLEGPRAIHVSACAAGTLAISHAASLISRGAAEIVICGGSDSMVNPLGIGGMSRIGAPSPRAASDACRPFDRRRDGLAIGEGAAVFVVESAERARARGASPLAEILGWGSTQDGFRVTAPLPDGAMARRAMEVALRRAQLDPGDIGYVNAHGTGTPLNDPAEAKAIRGLLGDVPVSSTKGAIGHLMAAAGAVELAACLLPFQRELLPGTVNHVERDPECDLDVIGPAPRAARVDAVLSNSFGFGGQNASIILGRCR